MSTEERKRQLRESQQRRRNAARGGKPGVAGQPRKGTVQAMLYPGDGSRHNVKLLPEVRKRLHQLGHEWLRRQVRDEQVDGETWLQAAKRILAAC